MNRNRISVGIMALVALVGASASAELMDRPFGYRIGQRLVLRPFVTAGVHYDSNVEGRDAGRDDFGWTISPNLGLEYIGVSWQLLANVWYQYNGYKKNEYTMKNSSTQFDHHAYGEDLTVRWTDALPGDAGWSVMFSEKYQKIAQLEAFTDSIGRNYDRDRQEVKVAGAVQRRFGAGLHADINANYYWLDYVSSNKQMSPAGLYGWERWGVGGELGYALSNWTDLLLAGSYQKYDQDNRNNNFYYGNGVGRESGSEGWTAQVGFGSFATDRITYRLLAGWSCFMFDEGGERSDGFSYTASANWNISQTWRTMLLATSHYQPSEREYGSSTRVDSISWGISHSMIQGKLDAAADFCYRREGREHEGTQTYDYDLDYLAARLNLTYIMNRYLQFFGTVEYMKTFCEDDDSLYGNDFEYARFRGTLGVRFTY